ncbi:SbcC/MukB-like Walker B domain-containing protein [Bacillota bacterium LX-D]|nr:SbcC/MukB-like Walker B domain-containing protein [Bacillota bacterium LX-D]
MKPIYLRISGLNSFRQSQEIQFEQLCAAGIFGIFGPTGSGKSSILDAITLALYGKVSRTNGTQGIMNQNEKRMSVEYLFNLGPKSYLVSRSYRRKDEKSLVAANCRLVEINGDREQVLADKSEEVTKRIEGIIGLKFEDFTRAVVLPQGRFAEFLNLSGENRRRMLERIFALEEYGEKLNFKLNTRAAQVDSDLQGVVQYQLGLGDASGKAVRTAELEVEKISELVAKLSTEYNALLLRYEEDKAVWKLQEDLKSLLVKEEELIAQGKEIDLLKVIAMKAKKAQGVKPLLEEQNKLTNSLQELSLKIGVKSKELHQAQLEKKKAEEFYQKSQAERISLEPQLLASLYQLEEAQHIEKELALRQQKLQKLRDHYGELQRKGAAIGEEILKLNELREKTGAALQQRKDCLKKIEVTPEERQQVIEAAGIWQSCTIIAAEKEKLKQEINLATNELNSLVSKNRTSQEKLHKEQIFLGKLETELLELRKVTLTEQEIGSRVQMLERTRAVISNAVRLKAELNQVRDLQSQEEKGLVELGKIISLKEQQLQQLNKQIMENSQKKELWQQYIKELELKNSAGYISAVLVSGEPCPVCGSRQHPAPAAAVAAEDLEKAAKEITALEESYQHYTQRKNELAVELARIEESYSAKQEAAKLRQEEIKSIEGELHNFLSKLPQELAKEPESLWNQWLEKEENAINIVAANLRSRQEKEKQKNEEFGQKQNVVQWLKEEAAVLAADQTALERSILQMQKKLDQYTRNLAAKEQEFKAIWGEVSAQKLLARQKEIKEQDKQAALFSKDLEQLEKENEGLRKKADELNKVKVDLELKLKELETVGQQEKEEFEAGSAKLAKITDGKPATELLQAAQQQLKKIQHNAEVSQKAWEQAKEKLNQTTSSLKSLETEKNLQEKSLAEINHRLQQSLEQLGFATAEEAWLAVAKEQEIAQMEEKIENFQTEYVLVKKEKEKIIKKLGNRKVTPTEWEKWKDKLQEAEKAHAQCLQQLGAAQNKLSDLLAKRGEWEQLEEKREKYCRELELLNTLKKTFRGRAFVDYLAEEQLRSVALDASQRLAQLTNGRYALEISSDGSFIIRDDANGGLRRTVNTLSGGETFLTSLALALALSSQIQLLGQYPLEFFFLDEGFGSLDPYLLEMVINTLERLQTENISIGVISHVPELRDRIPRKLLVLPAEPGGAGSRVRLELA